MSVSAVCMHCCWDRRGEEGGGEGGEEGGGEGGEEGGGDA